MTDEVQKSIYYQRDGAILCRCSRCRREHRAFGNAWSPGAILEDQLDEIENGSGFADPPGPRSVEKVAAHLFESERDSKSSPLYMLPVLIGSHVLGVICRECQLAVTTHISALWPDVEGLPYVNAKTGELANTRCSGCGMPYGQCKHERDESRSGSGHRLCCPECNHGAVP
jgi:hypothetical protein